VKYQCSKNYHAEGVCEANCHVKLISTKLLENILVLFFVIDNKMFTAAILKIPRPTVEKDDAAKCRT